MASNFAVSRERRAVVTSNAFPLPLALYQRICDTNAAKPNRHFLTIEKLLFSFVRNIMLYY